MRRRAQHSELLQVVHFMTISMSIIKKTRALATLWVECQTSHAHYMCEMMGDRKRTCDVSSSFISSTETKTHNVGRPVCLSRTNLHHSNHNRGPHTSTAKPRTCQYCRPQSRIIRQPDIPHHEEQPSIFHNESVKRKGNNGSCAFKSCEPQHTATPDEMPGSCNIYWVKQGDERSTKGVSCMVFVWPQPRPSSQTLAHHLLLTFGIWGSHLLDLFTLSNLWPGDVQLYTRNIPWSVPPPKPPKPMTYNVIEPDW